jgi:hypothetical protein
MSEVLRNFDIRFIRLSAWISSLLDDALSTVEIIYRWMTWKDVGFFILTAMVIKLYLLGYNAVYSAESQPAFAQVSCSAYSSTLKLEATCSSETSVDFQRTKRRYIQDDRTLQMKRWLWILCQLRFESLIIATPVCSVLRVVTREFYL